MIGRKHKIIELFSQKMVFGIDREIVQMFSNMLVTDGIY